MVGVAGSVLSEADPPLLEADVNVAFTAEVTRADKVAPGARKDRSILKMAPTRASGAGAMTDRKKVSAYGRIFNILLRIKSQPLPPPPPPLPSHRTDEL